MHTGDNYTKPVTGSYQCDVNCLFFSICLCCQVTLWNGDALALCTSGLPKEMLFDIIDTSNVSDHIGLLNVLVCCAPRLKLYVNLNTCCCYRSLQLMKKVLLLLTLAVSQKIKYGQISFRAGDCFEDLPAMLNIINNRHSRRVIASKKLL